MAARRAGALFVLADVMFVTHRMRLVGLAARARLPAMYAQREFVDDGGLLSYGATLSDNVRRAVTCVDRILKGAKPPTCRSSGRRPSSWSSTREPRGRWG